MTGPRAWFDTLRWCGAVGVGCLLVLRCVTLFAAGAVFDTDPALDPTVLGGLALAGSLRIDTAILLAAGAALIGESRSRGLDGRLLLLALVPVPILLLHGRQDAENLRIGATWIAGAVAAVAMLHAARDPRLRTVLLVLLLAAVAPIFVRGISTATVEHASTVAEFEANRDRILLDKGWSADSPSARIFERRLRQAQPTAWFVTTNIFGSFAVVGLVVSVGIVAAGWRRRVRRDVLFAVALFGALAFVLARWTDSMGALAAAFIGAALALVVRWRPRLARGSTAVAVVLLAMSAIAVRGVVLPESFAGDHSLLFRWHYQVGSLRAFARSPVLGVGPAGLQTAYARYRPARSPEEVSSTHSIFTDWVVRAGLPALAWVGLAFVLVAGSGRSLGDDGEPPPAGVPPGVWFRAITVAAVFGVAVGVAFEVAVLDGDALAVRAAGVLAYAALAAALAALSTRIPLASAAAAAAVALVVHSQVEMTMAQPASAAWCFALLGLAAAPASTAAWPRFGLAGAALVVVTGAWIGLTGAIPAGRMEAAMFDAARPLWPIADARAAMATGAEDGLDRALRELGIEASTPAAIDQALRERERVRRPQAADALLAAREWMPSSLLPAEAALTQLERANWQSEKDDRIALLLRERELARSILPRSVRATTLMPWIDLELFDLTGDTTYRDARIDFLRERTGANPWGLAGWLTLADALWEAGRLAEARKAYRRVLECDENYALDALKRLPEDERRRVAERAGGEDG